MIGDAPLVRLCLEEKGKELWLSPYLESLFSLYQYFECLHFFLLIIKVRNVRLHFFLLMIKVRNVRLHFFFLIIKVRNVSVHTDF